MEELKNYIIDIFSNVVVKIYPLLGQGEQVAKKIDMIATEEYGKIIEWIEKKKHGKVEILSVEGERDGISNTKIQNYNNDNNSDFIVSLDPIEGTLTGSLNGSRCMSVIAIYKNKDRRKYKKLPDSLSCFSAASKYDKNFLNNLCCEEDRKIGLKLYKNRFSTGNISTLRRKETQELWNNILEINSDEFTGKYKIELGEDTFYMQNMLHENIFLCGDSSIFLPFESDYFFGRTGVAEARIESQLWNYWRGLLVSSKKMSKYPSGRLNYLIDRLEFVKNREKYQVSDFFEPDELQFMKNNNWELDEIVNYIEKDMFSPQYDVIMIFSITGTKDRKFLHHSKENMKPLVYNSSNNEYTTELWIKENDKLNKKTLKIKGE